ncbi:MAG: D-alanyl-D-alanine carboxypeptidase [Clostridia bacterium]|nr:D-alanyl-D-alanine carboxypeptidase [Clostridia bacterium]
MKKLICFFVCLIMLPVSAYAEVPDGVNAKSAILIEQSTGMVLAENEPDERLPVASVTKIMTMLLIMERIDSGALSYEDMVSVSENAMSYGGSTMFLEAGEELSVSDMLKGIAVASANDGCVAMAEHIAGSESAFVDMMNARAAELGMENTHFMNTNGLDEDDHYSSARDVALMSRELLEHPKITEYTSIWTDELRGGKFKLANTNKLIRFYNGANGLKTGSTSKALCCLSASAARDGMQLIAVVLGAPTSAERFGSAKALLDYGFANYAVTQLCADAEEIADADVINGESNTVKAIAAEEKTLVGRKADAGDIERQVRLTDELRAPVKAGDVIGSLDFSRGGEVIDSVELVAAQDVAKKGIGRILAELVSGLLVA